MNQRKNNLGLGRFEAAAPWVLTALAVLCLIVGGLSIYRGDWWWAAGLIIWAIFCAVLALRIANERDRARVARHRDGPL